MATLIVPDPKDQGVSGDGGAQTGDSNAADIINEAELAGIGHSGDQNEGSDSDSSADSDSDGDGPEGESEGGDE